MKYLFKLVCVATLAFGLAACVERPENEMVQETERVDPASGIDLTTQVDGTFKGFADEEKGAVIIEVDGADKIFDLAEDATGDFEALQEGDAISFSTKSVDDVELIETLWKK